MQTINLRGEMGMDVIHMLKAKNILGAAGMQDLAQPMLTDEISQRHIRFGFFQDSDDLTF